MTVGLPEGPEGPDGPEGPARDKHEALEPSDTEQ